ncbi:MAG: glucuronyl hydrolase [Kofleriaceae bacterium]
MRTRRMMVRLVVLAAAAGGVGCSSKGGAGGDDNGMGGGGKNDGDDTSDAGTPDAMPVELFEAAFQFSQDQLRAMVMTVPHDAHPTATDDDGEWLTEDSPDWRSGFYTGSLWIMYEHTDDVFWKTAAEAQQADLEQEKTEQEKNDTGFKVLSSFGRAFQLTNNDDYRQVVVTAANTYALGWDDDVGAVNTFHLDDFNGNPFGTIIDHVMNLEIMTWAASHGGSSTLRDKAISHARKSLADHVRPDGSTYHVVVYDEDDGDVEWRGTRQGADDETTWSRGQAWAVYGFTMMYRETQEMDFLEGARKTADWYIAHLPADFVPYWDFDRPNEERDSSAAAIAASGLLELAHIETDAANATRYRDAAFATLASLASSAYLAQGTGSKATLLHAVTSKPGNNEVDVSLIYGDYYFHEALLRLRAWFGP